MLRDPYAPAAPMPAVSSSLIDALEEFFPLRDIRKGEDVDSIRHYAGQRSVIAFLRRIHDEQKGTAL